MEEKLLPIGTVCTLRNQKKIMITGFIVCNPESPNEIYDYSGCLYPEGTIDSEVNFMFNHDRIEKIDHLGYVNEDETKFKQQLDELLNQKISKINTSENNKSQYQSINSQPNISSQQIINKFNNN